MSWFSDNLMSIVLLIVLAVIVFFIIRSKIKAKKNRQRLWLRLFRVQRLQFMQY